MWGQSWINIYDLVYEPAGEQSAIDLTAIINERNLDEIEMVEIAENFFLSLGVNILQGYGQTEASPIISCNRPGNIRIETVGPALTEVEIKIADDGEILVSGENVMNGYWNDPEATAATLVDGWIHTGDIGVFENGYLKITDRKKDILKC